MKKKAFIYSILFLILAILMSFGLTNSFDQAFCRFFIERQTSLTICIAQFLSLFASVKGFIALCVVLIFFLSDNKKRFYMILSLLISSLAIVLSKNIFARPRPLIGQALLSDYSFPSGHTFSATVFYGLLLYYINQSSISSQKKKICNILLCTFIFLIAFSRILLGVHYLTDVLGGFFFGSSILCLILSFYEKTDEKKEKERPLWNSVQYAEKGIMDTVKNEQNMVIHFLISILVIIAGIIYHISYLEWLICFLLFGIIFALELINTAIENVVDLVTKEKKEKARMAKDAAAGAVLIASIFAGIIGIMIFLPKFLG